MKKQLIQTKIGEIAVFLNDIETKEIPIIFLHGVYFDHHLWDYQVSQIVDRKVICVDMPFHGESKNVHTVWNLDDCAGLVIEILNALNIEKVIAIGHSWGSMTLLRVSHKNPERFASIGLCNMPFEEAGVGRKIAFRLQHAFIGMRGFYIDQAAKSLFGKESMLKSEVTDVLKKSMIKLSRREIILTDQYVILDAQNAADIIKNLIVPVTFLKGVEDYVPTPAYFETVQVKGGHISPIEAPDDVANFIQKVIALA
jgi:3-oxoadipate enol-lactonase